MSQISSSRQPIPSDAVRSRPSWLYSFWKFSRPHTIIGTSLSVLGLYFVAAGPLAIDRPLVPLLALLACLCGNVYIVGLNQLEDVEIDRINKPHLPIAAGEFSRQTGWLIVLLLGLLALGLSAWQGIFLAATVWSSLLIGTAYSLPPLRLKRFPVWASLCIFTVRGAIVNLGLFLHFQQQLGQSFAIPPRVWALTLFILVFTFAIAIFKDIPDLEGDRRYHITTFTVRLGQQTVFNLARAVLSLCYAGMIVAASWLPGVNAPFLILSHGIVLAGIWGLSLRVKLQDKSSIARFYQFIWKLFYLEYILFPIACSLGSHGA